MDQSQDISLVERLSPTRMEKFTTRVLPFIILAVVLFIIPLFGPSRTAYSLLNVIGINIVFALSYNMLLGQTGMLSFGHAVYFGLGGYGAIHAMNWIADASLDGGGFWASYPVFALPIVGFAVGAAAGAIIGWPSCRRSGVPFAMISLGIAELVAAAGFMFISIFGGEEGVSADRMNGIEAFGLSLGPINEVYLFIAFWTLVGTIGIYAYTRTPLGRMAQAVRDNPERVEFVGYDPQHVRYLTFIASGGFAGLAGGMAAINYEIFTPEAFSLIPSGFVLLMAYIGGIKYFAGPMLGATLLTVMQSNLSDYSEAWLLYLGIMFIIVVLYAPGGLAGLLLDGYKALTNPGGGKRLFNWTAMTGAGAVASMGCIMLVELGVRLSNGNNEPFEPFGLDFHYDSVMPWVIGIVLLGAGLAAIRWLVKQENEA